MAIDLGNWVRRLDRAEDDLATCNPQVLAATLWLSTSLLPQR